MNKKFIFNSLLFTWFLGVFWTLFLIVLAYTPMTTLVFWFKSHSLVIRLLICIICMYIISFMNLIFCYYLSFFIKELHKKDYLKYFSFIGVGLYIYNIIFIWVFLSYNLFPVEIFQINWDRQGWILFTFTFL